MTEKRLRELYLLANSIGAALKVGYSGPVQVVPILPINWRPSEALCLTGHVTLWSQGYCDDTVLVSEPPMFCLDDGDGDTITEAQAKALAKSLKRRKRQ